MARDRQQHPHVAPMQRSDQLDRAGLGTDGHIGANGFAVGHQRGQMRNQGPVLGVVLVRRQRAPGGQDRGTKFGFRLAHGTASKTPNLGSFKPT